VNVAYEVFFLCQWLIYLLRLVLSFAYGTLQFIAKPARATSCPSPPLPRLIISETRSKPGWGFG